MLKKRFLGIGMSAILLMSAILPANVFAAEKTATPVAHNEPINIVMNSYEIQPMWVMPGKRVQKPNEGGTWEYGFWDIKYRSYYTVNRCHGSTVISGNRKSRSIDTASGEKSIAELWAINNSGADPHYYYRVCD